MGERFNQFMKTLGEEIYVLYKALEPIAREHRAREKRRKELEQLYRREPYIISLNNRRAREKGLPATLTLEEWIEILDRHGWKCAYGCERPYEELEHIIPLHHRTKGTTKDNCVPACKICNAVKGRHHPDLLKQVSDGIERLRYEQSSNAD